MSALQKLYDEASELMWQTEVWVNNTRDSGSPVLLRVLNESAVHEYMDRAYQAGLAGRCPNRCCADDPGPQ